VTTLNVAGTRASVDPPDAPLDDWEPPPEIGAPPELLVPVELPLEPTAAPPDAVVFVDGVVFVVVVEAALVVVDVAALVVGVVVLLAALWLVLECEEPPHPAMVRKTGRRAERASRRLTFSAYP
jgi:hypothetical protein